MKWISLKKQEQPCKSKSLLDFSIMKNGSLLNKKELGGLKGGDGEFTTDQQAELG